MKLTTDSPFDITYDGSSVVTLRASAANATLIATTPAERLEAQARDEADWARLLDEGHKMLAYFRPSKPGSSWGCDGVGYGVQRRMLEVLLHQSGVGPVNFHRGCMAYMREVLHVEIPKAPEVQTKRPRVAKAATIRSKSTPVIVPPQSKGYRTGDR